MIYMYMYCFIHLFKFKFPAIQNPSLPFRKTSGCKVCRILLASVLSVCQRLGASGLCCRLGSGPCCGMSRCLILTTLSSSYRIHKFNYNYWSIQLPMSILPKEPFGRVKVKVFPLQLGVEVQKLFNFLELGERVTD